MFKRMAIVLTSVLVLGACDEMTSGMTALEKDALTLKCYEIERMENNKLYVSNGEVLALPDYPSIRVDENNSAGRTVCGNTGINGLFSVKAIDEDAERIQELQEYYDEIEMKKAKESIRE